MNNRAKIEIKASDSEFTPHGNDLFGEPNEAKHESIMGERFLLSPFSVLNARDGWWQERKRAWRALGISGELGRGENLTHPNLSDMDKMRHRKANAEHGGSKRPAAKPGPDGKTQRTGHHLTGDCGNRECGDLDETSRKNIASDSSGTSVFDPVLCELAFRWFCPRAGTVLDPFAGGSVRGIVASKLRLQYIGVELRPEQVEANRAQAVEICGAPVPIWHVGDSRDIETIAPNHADFIFSCPPYADLEVYSDDPRDLSILSYPEFRKSYSYIIAATCRLLKDDRFACFVVGDVRGKNGCYYGFPWHTIEAFEEAGLRLYNEAVLVTAAGSLPLRAGGPFATSRKLGKTHQNILIFVKGDPKRATTACGKFNGN